MSKTGTRGPVPKRSEDRIRRNKDENGPVEKLHVIGPVEVPELMVVDPHPIVAEWFESLKESAQSKYYERSDWATAQVVAHLLNIELNKGSKVSSLMMQTLHSYMTDLLTTEGSRRRVRLEIERNNEGAEIFDLSDRIKEMLDKTG